MKSALSYLTAKKLKNRIKSFLKSPAYIIYGIVLIALMVFVALSPQLEGAEGPKEYRSMTEFIAILMAFYTIMFVMVFSQAYSRGSSMFTLSDVNLLFPSPMSPQKVLYYGIFRQLGTSLVVGFFLLFQYSWLNQLYGITFLDLVIAILGYSVTIFLSQYTAMVLFCYTSDNPRAQRIVSFGVYALVFILVLIAMYSIMPSYKNGDLMGLLPLAADFFAKPIVMAFPISGWVAGICYGIFTGEYIYILIFGLVIAVFFTVLSIFMVRSKKNFYEDVIAAAETSQSAINAQKEGQVGEVVGKNVRVGKEGIGRGSGASAIMYKHFLENRRSGLFIISNVSLIFVAITIAMSVFMGQDMGVIGIFSMAAYMQIFSVMLGRFTRELSKPYIYLIPESPVKKLLYAVGESLFTGLIEALILFIPVSFILSMDPITTVLCIVGRVSFALLFTTGNIVLERVFGGIRVRALVMFFFFLVTLIMVIPGIVLAVLLETMGVFILVEFGSILVGLIVGNIVASVFTLFLCRNLLQYAELNNI